MTEMPFKRKRVTEDILSSSSNISIVVSQDVNKEKFNQVQIRMDRLEAENYKLLKQIECSNLTHEMSLKESTQTITSLISEGNDIKARAIHHQRRADEATKTLEVMKAKHIEVTNGLRDTITDDRRTIYSLEEALSAQQHENQDIGNDAQRDLDEYKAETAKLNSTIALLTQNNQDQSSTIQSGLERELALINRINELESTLLNQGESSSNQYLYNDLEEQYQRVCKHTTQLETDNAKLTSELKHYKSISQNVEYLRGEHNSLQDQLSKLNEISQAKFVLEVQNTNLLAERDAWTRYLESKPEYNQQSPGSIINNLSKQADEAKYLKSEIQQLKIEIENQNKLVGLLEDHTDELKKAVLEKERIKATTDAERTLMHKNDEILKKHISILQSQLQLYDNEEKINMEATYDQNKALRIAQLEMFLREIENQLKTQVNEFTKTVNASISPVPAFHGPYQELTSGCKILGFLKEINAQKEHYVQELKEAKSKSQKQFSEKEGSQKIQVSAMHTNIPTPEQPPSHHRILSLVENPDSQRYGIRKELLIRLQKENRHLLKLQIDAVHDGENVTLPKSTILNFEKEIMKLQETIENKDKRISRIQTMWEDKLKTTIARIRNLWGYNVHFKGDGAIRLESIFVDATELSFLIKEEEEKGGKSILRIVGSNKDKYIQDLNVPYESYIVNEGNIPAFLNAASDELCLQFKRQEGTLAQEGAYSFDEDNVYNQYEVPIVQEDNAELVYKDDDEYVQDAAELVYRNDNTGYEYEMESIQEVEEEEESNEYMREDSDDYMIVVQEEEYDEVGSDYAYANDDTQEYDEQEEEEVGSEYDIVQTGPRLVVVLDSDEDDA